MESMCDAVAVRLGDFRTETPLSDAVFHLQAHGIHIVRGPVMASGERAKLRSIYFHDPDENLIEMSNES